ncbi:hypothetical protein [Asanoa siamensis]|uniref:hypothetical protein n=1 Tax=Asanoa siamensis TaxID=926357 RepID=UPI001944523C|nr:hypothetical protein [Asanoa siamensis]
MHGEGFEQPVGRFLRQVEPPGRRTGREVVVGQRAEAAQEEPAGRAQAAVARHDAVAHR